MNAHRTTRFFALSIALLAIAGSLSVMLSACNLPPIYEYWDSIVLKDLEISPSFIALQEGQKAVFSVQGGKGPYSYEISGGGDITALASHSVEYSAPAVVTDVWITVRDVYDAQSLARVMVEASISRLTIVPANVSLGHGGSLDFEFQGGKAPYTFTLEEGMGTIDELSGLYIAPAMDTNAVVRLEDESGQISDAIISVQSGTPPLVIDPVSVELEADETFTFGVMGGVAPYSFIVDSGVGSIDSITGEYSSGVMGSAIVSVTDSSLATALSTVTVVTVPAIPLVISPRSLKLKKGTSFQFSAQGGDPPYTFAMIYSYGGTIDPVSGVYMAPSWRTGTEFVRVVDSQGRSDWTTVKIKNH